MCYDVCMEQHTLSLKPLHVIKEWGAMQRHCSIKGRTEAVFVHHDEAAAVGRPSHSHRGEVSVGWYLRAETATRRPEIEASAARCYKEPIKHTHTHTHPKR